MSNIQDAAVSLALTSALFGRFTELDCPAGLVEHHGLAAGPLTLRRVWPQQADEIALEYVDTQGQLLAGLWLGDHAKFTQRCQTLAPQAPNATAEPPWALPARHLLFLPRGLDRRLPGLAPLLATPQATLLVHRPERRAVVRLQETAGVRYAKVVRPARAHELAALMQPVQELAAGSFQTPTVERVDAAQGILYLSALPGQALYECMGQGQLVALAHATGRLLRQLHGLPIPAAAQPHSADHECQVLDKWLRQVGWLAPTLAQALQPAYAQVCAGLQAGLSPSVLLHRDFYDKQVFITTAGATGLLDFDLLAVGEGALDVANAVAHFELRALQGNYDLATAAAAIDALLDGYQPTAFVQRRLQAYVDATRLRLACVYSCRPYGLAYIPALLARMGKPLVCACC